MSLLDSHAWRKFGMEIAATVAISKRRQVKHPRQIIWQFVELRSPLTGVQKLQPPRAHLFRE